MWVRGLKLIGRHFARCAVRSHPMWVRGLKLLKLIFRMNIQKSHPMWVRGLKRKGSLFRLHNVVAPYVGAWIETSTRV